MAEQLIARLADKEADYKRYGITKKPSYKEDGMRTNGGKGTFEWWYTDVTFKDGTAVVVIFFYATYNGFVNKEEGLKTAWSNVETQYQRRADLIPNLVNTVKGYAAHESQTFEAVTEARAKATSINLSADDLTPEKLAEFQQAQAQVRSALGRLIAVSESYPDLKANQNFLELQAQLEGTENRISVARKEFNEVAKTYNVAVRRFPANLVAKLFGFGQKPYFEAAEGTETAPRVQF